MPFDLFTNTPDRYSQDDLIGQIFKTWEAELEQFDRWTRYESRVALQHVLNGDYYYNHEGILAQWFARLASGEWLQWWEDMLGIPSDLTLTDRDRRNNILARMKQRGDIPTPQYILNIVQQYVDLASVVININAYSFAITIIYPRAFIPLAVQEQIRLAIEAAKPAHLAYTINFTEESWVLLGARDWLTIGNTDWPNLNF